MITTAKELSLDFSEMTTEEILNVYCPTKSYYDNDGVEVKQRFMEITPILAAVLLERNTKNRSISKGNLNDLRKEVETDNWRFTGDSIKIDKNGKLIDGQHRLTIVVETGKPIFTSVVSGLNPNVFSVLDTGRKRQGGDVLSIYGVENAGLVSSTIKMVQKIERGAYGVTGKTTKATSNQEVLDYYKKNKNISESVTLGNNLYKKSSKLISPTVISAVHFIFSKKSKTAAEDFLEKLCTGVGLEAKTPIYVLRDKLLKIRMNEERDLVQGDLIAFVLLAWNKYRVGEKCIKLKLPTEKITII